MIILLSEGLSSIKLLNLNHLFYILKNMPYLNKISYYFLFKNKPIILFIYVKRIYDNSII